MRRPWIKIEVSTPDKPEVCTIATKLRIDPDSVVGKLVRLWSWAELNGVDSNDLSVTKEFLDKLCSRKGFADALISANWLIEEDGKLRFPKFERHNGYASKVRGLTARRVELHRHRKGKPNAKSVTKITIKKGTPKAEAPPAPTEVAPEPVIETPVVEAVEMTPPPPAEVIVSPPPPAEVVTAVETAIAEPEPATAEGAPAAEEPAEKPKKRRAKSEAEDDSQPLLF